MPIELKGETFYSSQEAADLLGVHMRTLRRILASGRLVSSRMGNRIFISDSALVDMLSKPAEKDNNRLTPETREKMRANVAHAREVLRANREARAQQGGQQAQDESEKG